MHTHTESHSSSKQNSVQIEYQASGIPVLRLGDPGERVVTFSMERMASLREALIKIRNERPHAVVIAGPHAEMFTAGADINLIKGVADAALGEKLAKEGQAVFDLIQELPFPSIAAISGPCVGGGCELTLACSYRIISDHKSSIIGLPEIKLGIIPGFGGTQRLPRLCGLPNALSIILQGKTVKPKHALALGLVDEVVSVDKLLERAHAYATGELKFKPRSLSLKDRLLTMNPLGRSLVRHLSLKQIKKETKGFYPAPAAALECAVYGLERGQKLGLENEARQLGRMIVTPECKSLVNVFFLTEGAKAIGKSARKQADAIHAVVIGAGVMGAGIAGVLARYDCPVILKDTTEQAVQRGLKQVREYLERSKSLSQQEKSFILNRIESTTTHSTNTGNANFAIEAIFEDMPIKKKILSEIAQLMPQDAIIATNTSSLSVSEISEAIPSPERVVGMHFFNPVPLMPLVEIIRGRKTSDKTISIVAALASKLNKYPIVVNDVPGFLVNRILSPYLNEAAFLMEHYSVLDIDKAALRFGLPMGPIRLLDEIGLDVAMHVQQIMLNGYGERMRGPGYAKQLCELGRKGKKSGKGFYDYVNGEPAPSNDMRDVLKLTLPKEAFDLAPVTERLIMSLINEAVRCLDEGVAGAPGRDAAAQIDLGTVMGMGFPPFRGGLMHYAESLGAASIFESLKRLELQFGARFAPAAGIEKRAKSNRSFYAAA